LTYWLPLPLGLLAAVLHRRRYAPHADADADADADVG
jgi:hypothetical protein